MAKTHTVPSDFQRGRVVEIVLKLEYPDDLGAAPGASSGAADYGKLDA